MSSFRLFALPHAVVAFHQYGALTSFFDGTSVNAQPHDTTDYRARARMLGYGDDTLAMCREHELLHSVAAELLHDEPSPVLLRMARGDRSRGLGWGEEEALVLGLQAALRGGRTA